VSRDAHGRVSSSIEWGISRSSGTQRVGRRLSLTVKTVAGISDDFGVRRRNPVAGLEAPGLREELHD
jgi:hypothetical protein